MHRCSRGFTLVELMVVVGIIAIIAAVAFPRYTSLRKDYSVYNAARQMGSDIRYAWQLAVDGGSSGGGASVQYQESGYTIFRNGRQVKAVTFEPGIEITSTSPASTLSPPGTLSFGSLGEPVLNGSASGVTFTIQSTGGGSNNVCNVQVSPGTGKVTVIETP